MNGGPRAIQASGSVLALLILLPCGDFLLFTWGAHPVEMPLTGV